VSRHSLGDDLNPITACVIVTVLRELEPPECRVDARGVQNLPEWGEAVALPELGRGSRGKDMQRLSRGGHIEAEAAARQASRACRDSALKPLIASLYGPSLPALPGLPRSRLGHVYGLREAYALFVTLEPGKAGEVLLIEISMPGLGTYSA
jgi:hypothetical protein